VWFDTTSNRLYARTHGTLSSAWARVYTPDFDYVNGSVSTLPVVVMSAADDSTWSGQYAGGWVIGDYLFKSDGLDENGKLVMGAAVTFTSTKVGVQRRARPVPGQLMLAAAGARGTPLVRYALPGETMVRLCVYDMRGRLAATLVVGRQPAGYYTVAWDRGPSGNYIVRLRAGNAVLTSRMTVVR